MYFIAKTTAEKAAWEFAKEKGLDVVTIQPPVVVGPFVTPSLPPSAKLVLAVLTGTSEILRCLGLCQLVRFYLSFHFVTDVFYC